MSICGQNSGTYTHGGIKDVLKRLPYPRSARASNRCKAYLQEHHGCQIIVAYEQDM
jgi:hypothetical protein